MMLDSAAQLQQPSKSTPQKLTSNTKDVQKMVQAFLFSQKFFASNQSSIAKSFDSSSSQKQILQGQIQLLILIIKHLKHIYSRKQLENKNLQMHLQHYKRMFKKQTELKSNDLNSKMMTDKFNDKYSFQKSTLKKQEIKPAYFQSIQSSVSCFQGVERTLRTFQSKQGEKQNQCEDQMIRQNKQLKKCLEERDQKISDLTLQNDKLRVSFKKAFQELKILANDKEQLIIEQNIFSLKAQNQKGELQIQLKNIKNQKDQIQEMLKKLKSKLDQQYDCADYKEQCQFLRECFKSQLDNNYQLNSSKIKLLRKIDKLQKIIKASQTIKMSAEKYHEDNIVYQKQRKVKFYQNVKNSTKKLQNLTKQGNCIIQENQLQNQTSKQNHDENVNREFALKKFKKNQRYFTMQRKQEIKKIGNSKLNNFQEKSEQQNNKKQQKIQFLLKKLTQSLIKVEGLTKNYEKLKQQNNVLKEELKRRDLQNNQQINQLKLFFKKQLDSTKKKTIQSNQKIINIQLLPIETQKQEIQNNNLNKKEKSIQQSSKNARITQICSSYYQVLQEKIKDKIKQNQFLIQKVQQQQQLIQKLKNKQSKIDSEELRQSKLIENTLTRTILTQRKKFTIRYQNPFQEIHEHESIKIQQNQSESNRYYHKNIQLEHNSKGLIYNGYSLDNFNIFRCKLTQFYENVMNELEYWQNIELNYKKDEGFQQIQKEEDNKFENKQLQLKLSRNQLNKQSQEINKNVHFQAIVENILMEKMKQFQQFSKGLSTIKLIQQQQNLNYFQELNSCQSQYQYPLQDTQEIQKDERQNELNDKLYGYRFMPQKSMNVSQNCGQTKNQKEKERGVNNQSERGYLSKFSFVENLNLNKND